jgi:hypothetical protein
MNGSTSLNVPLKRATAGDVQTPSCRRIVIRVFRSSIRRVKYSSFPSGENAALSSLTSVETTPGAKSVGVIPGGVWPRYSPCRAERGSGAAPDAGRMMTNIDTTSNRHLSFIIHLLYSIDGGRYRSMMAASTQ